VSADPDALAQARACFEEGMAWLDAGEPAEAARAFEQGLARVPGRPSLLANLALARLQLGQRQDAEQAAGAALAGDPANVSAALTLAVCLQARGDFEAALVACDRLLARDAGLAAAWCSRGHALHGLKREEEALAAYGRALAVDAQQTEAWAGLADTLACLQVWEDGLSAAQRALELDPEHVASWINLGFLLDGLGRRGEALAAVERACVLAPDNLRALLNCAKLLADARRFAEADACLDAVDALLPDHPEAIWQRALLWLAVGDFARGWPAYEARWRMPEVNPAFDRGLPRLLELTQARNATVLVWSEQGLGDTLQFYRYVPKLIAAGARVVLEVQPPLLALLAAQSPAIACIARGAALPLPCTTQIPLISLPLLLGQTGAPPAAGLASAAPAEAGGSARFTAPAAAASPAAALPYLRPPAATMMERLAGIGRPRSGRLRIALACAGNPGHPNDAWRSLPLERLLPLQEHAELLLVQPELRPADRQVAERAGIAWPGQGVRDFADTARLLAGVDRVLSVDTALAHLGGALGVPTWVLLPYAADWRWGLAGERCDWYASARLFRQPSAGDWDAVVAAVRDALVEGSGVR
jgi:tetratricopeptide (TPR) repeat protein